MFNKFIFFFIILLNFLILEATASELPSQLVTQMKEILKITKYFETINENTITEKDLIKKLDTSLSYFDISNSDNFSTISQAIEKIKVIYRSINNSTTLRDLPELKSLAKKIKDFYAVYNIEKSMNDFSYTTLSSTQQSPGEIGARVGTAIPFLGQEFGNIGFVLLKKLIGRIFVVVKEEGKDRIVNVGSGMLVPNFKGHQRVVTCKHLLRAEGENLRFYFVRAEMLNNETGWFAQKYENEEEFIKKIELEAKAAGGNAVAIVPSEESPIFEQTKTDGLALCNLMIRNFEDVQNFPIPIEIICNDKIESIVASVTNTRVNVSVATSSPSPSTVRYYAFGYPVTRFLDLLHLDDMPWIIDKGIAPLTITSSIFKRLRGHPVPRLRPDGAWLHTAPTSTGMSGGPILLFDQATIKIIGVIGAGNDILDGALDCDNVMCSLVNEK